MNKFPYQKCFLSAPLHNNQKNLDIYFTHSNCSFTTFFSSSQHRKLLIIRVRTLKIDVERLMDVLVDVTISVIVLDCCWTWHIYESRCVLRVSSCQVFVVLIRIIQINIINSNSKSIRQHNKQRCVHWSWQPSRVYSWIQSHQRLNQHNAHSYLSSQYHRVQSHSRRVPSARAVLPLEFRHQESRLEISSTLTTVDSRNFHQAELWVE